MYEFVDVFACYMYVLVVNRADAIPCFSSCSLNVHDVAMLWAPFLH